MFVPFQSVCTIGVLRLLALTRSTGSGAAVLGFGWTSRLTMQISLNVGDVHVIQTWPRVTSVKILLLSSGSRFSRGYDLQTIMWKWWECKEKHSWLCTTSQWGTCISQNLWDVKCACYPSPKGIVFFQQYIERDLRNFIKELQEGGNNCVFKRWPSTSKVEFDYCKFEQYNIVTPKLQDRNLNFENLRSWQQWDELKSKSSTCEFLEFIKLRKFASATWKYCLVELYLRNERPKISIFILKDSIC